VAKGAAQKSRKPLKKAANRSKKPQIRVKKPQIRVKKPQHSLYSISNIQQNFKFVS
jgi:hypothetical protein